MKLLNFKTQDLHQSETSYTFEDVQVKMFQDETLTIEGSIDVDFEPEDESGTDDEERIVYYILNSNVKIDSIFDSEDNRVHLSYELMNELIHEIENKLDTYTIENH